YPESKVRDAVRQNKRAKIYYQADPVYKNSELVPRGTHVRAYSVNDNGKTLNMNLWVFNRQDGVKINYRTGTWNEV
ncbi:endonuclease, partial [Streptococcus anginosus]|nr:endonuclease [Streptococcus anginosus]